MAVDRVAFFGLSRIALCVVPAIVACASPSAWAQDYADSSGKSLIATADLRLVAADGERSWIDGGFGKSRFGPDAPLPANRLRIDPRAIEGDLAWTPQLGWSLGAMLAVTAQDGQEHPVDLSEAYLTWLRGPHGNLKLSGRAGLFWPPVSLEHSGATWAVTETITPSAINSWIGEEVKVGGAEATASTAIAHHGRVYATLGLFGFNDTAGTLLAFRGWALSDLKATAFGQVPLPPRAGFLQFAQAGTTRPVIELDNRPGYYARFGWTPEPAIRLHAFYYDNRGNPEASTAGGQWGWRTRFTELGGTAALGATRITAQAMAGRTGMGFPMAGGIWVDTRFRSAYALLTQTIGKGSLSGRIEAFGTRSEGSVSGPEDSEDGWAATLAARRSFGEHVTLLAEALHVDSDRDARARTALTPQQDQNVLQLSLRLHN
ncbi:MAG: hypothetical protein JWN66_1963 [Sphingomonas bacterium]|uniref:hypothetical protein n=1 Tax=Sphingomonas bacterium TaxID=1895847 RepID=UPI00260C4332|nr:hypothetical protein [Sphingomonas bacterium]MDB5704847.1 hypothetical protein [Sphingomonas bacterium]